MPSILHAAWLPSQQPTIINGELFLWARSLDFAAQPQSNNNMTSVGIAEERQRIPSHPHQTQLSQLRQQIASQFPSTVVDRMRPVNATAWFPTLNGVPESRRSVFQQLSAQNGSGKNGAYEDDSHGSHLIANGSANAEPPSHSQNSTAEDRNGEQATVEKTTLATWQITGVAISAIDALHFLSQLSSPELLNEKADDADKNHAKNGSAASHPLERLRIGNDLLFFSSVSKFALEILASQHYLPGIRSDANRGFLAVWQPALFDADLVERFDTLVHEMPPVCRAYNLETPAAALPAATLTENMVASLVDSAIRTWYVPNPSHQNGQTPHITNPTQNQIDSSTLASSTPDSSMQSNGNGIYEQPESHWFEQLLTEENRLNLPPQPIHRLYREWQAWMDQLHIASDIGFRICFVLNEPTEITENTAAETSASSQPKDTSASSEQWRLSYYLQSRNNPQILISSAEIWTTSATSLTIEDMRIDQPQERFLEGLGAVSHLFGPIAESLSSPRPEFAELTVHEAYQFMREVGPLLSSSGFGVILPSWWIEREERQLGLRLRLTSGDELAGEALPGLHTEVDYSWDLILGDELVDKASFERLVELDSPLVRIHGRWTELNPEQIDAAQNFFHERTASNKASNSTSHSNSNFGKMTLLQALRMITHKGSGLPVDDRGYDSSSGSTIEIDRATTEANNAKQQGKELADSLSAHNATNFSFNGLIETPSLLPLTGIDVHGWLDQAIDRLQESQSIPEVEEPTGFEGQLRPYQSRGVGWLSYLRRLGIGACLADDMGLGKTIQAIALHLYIKENQTKSKKHGEHKSNKSNVYPTLLICPTSVLINWQREINRFAPTLQALIHHGNNRLMGEAFLQTAAQQDFIITSYGTARRDIEFLQKPLWQDVILDEAQNIKNPNAKQTQAVRLLRSQHRIALTGTPIENRLSELWSIFEFLNPGYLGGHARFHKKYILPIERYNSERHISRLRQMVQPFLLRRLKTDPAIISDLPEKNEMVVYCSLTREQQQLYTQVVENTLNRLDESDGIQRRGLILGLITKLKQVANHPAHYLKERADSLTIEALNNRSGKLNRLTEMLEEALSVGDQALIFTQFVEMGSLLQAYLSNVFDESIPFLHGGTSALQRDRMVQEFQSEDGPPIFILSLRAGGSGLNLTRANHVFHFDRWWNPAIENQATDRAFRIGQERNVQVHKFVSAGTLEEHIHSLIESKKSLAENIVGSGEDWLTEMDNKQLRELLMLRGDLEQKELPA